MTKKFLIATFGCRTNQYESELFREQLKQFGLEESQEEVDLCLIHTCSVTEVAEKTCQNKIRFLVRKFPKARIVVTGCFAQRDSMLLKKINPRIEVMKERKKETIIPLLLGGGEAKKTLSQFQGHTRAFVKIQDGCNACCSYCIIPQLRGPSTSRSLKEILKEIHALNDKGYQEIVLTGINVGEYQGGLALLLKAIDRIPGIQRVRLSSIEPNHVDVSLMKVLLEGRAIMPHLHLVLQSASNSILKKMRRSYTRELFVEKVRELRKGKKEFCFTTDLIVGFPSETEEDVLQTAELIEEIGFAKVHIFPYSKRPKTAAARMKEQLPIQVIQKRKKYLSQIAEKSGYDLRTKFVGQKVEVLLEEEGIRGFTSHMLPVRLLFPHLPNQIVVVELVDNQKEWLEGRML